MTDVGARAGTRSRGPLERTAWWGLVSSSAAPVLLIGGWTLAAARQVPHFDPVTQTISELAAYGSDDRWVMSGALVGVGVCHLVTASALRPAARAGRLLLASGGAATVLVAAYPLTVGGGSSRAHTVVATVALGALAIWPIGAWRRGAEVPTALRPTVCAAATVVLLATLGWFAYELGADGSRIGLTERVAAGSQSLWPLAVVVWTRLVRAPT
jgi:hypothetical membrane protein